MLKINRPKSTARKPLVDISNGGKPSRPCKKKSPTVDHAAAPLDRLLLARSELSDLVGQIDELAAQALQHKVISRKANQEIESFREVLSDIHSTLKPWVSRFQQAFGSKNGIAQTLGTSSVCCANEQGNNSKNETELDLIVSPSPLVSWRAGTCTFERGKQLFLLTPLPKSKVVPSKCPVSSKPLVQIFSDKDQHGVLDFPPKSTVLQISHLDFLEESKVELEPKTSPLKLIVSTPCLKSSPKRDIPATEYNNSNSIFNGSDDLVKSEVSEDLTLKYQALLGLPTNNKFTKRREEPEETLNWFLSPPKTCVLMEPTDEKPLPTPALPIATPLWKDAESTVLKGKQQLGESTLKKELWTRFEEVSKDGLRLNASAFQKTARKGFLDMLEEACEGSDS